MGTKKREKQFIIYQAVNTVNGKRYIGVTSYSLATRRACHLSHARLGVIGCRLFSRALRKYGEDAFRWEVLKRVDTHEDAMAEEIRLIAETKPEYNLTRGGQGIVGLERTTIWRQRLSDANKGRQLTPEQRHRWLQNQRPTYKSVCCLDDGLWFHSVKAAAEHYGMRPTRISAGLKGHEITPGGLHFVYADAPLGEGERWRLRQEADKRRADGQERRRISRTRAVRCYTHGDQVFESGRAAAKAFGIAPSRVMQLCQVGGVTSAGVGFMYADAVAPPIKKVLSLERLADAARRRRAALDRSRERQAKAVICGTDGKQYPSVHAAGRAYGLLASLVSASIYRGTPTCGFQFSFAAAGT